MTTTLVDSNVLLDIITEDPVWFGWSSETLQEAADSSRVVVNVIVQAETSARFSRIEEMDDMLRRAGIERADIPLEAAFLAGKAFNAYRKRTGLKTSVLSDFFIGAHAVVGGFRLITRDAARMKTYFPQIRITSPKPTN